MELAESRSIPEAMHTVLLMVAFVMGFRIMLQSGFSKQPCQQLATEDLQRKARQMSQQQVGMLPAQSIVQCRAFTCILLLVKAACLLTCIQMQYSSLPLWLAAATASSRARKESLTNSMASFQRHQAKETCKRDMVALPSYG